jgi:Uma2 family endonuclease
MYDLPSEWPEEPGLPDVGASPSRDVFHDLQPQLLSRTLALADYSRDQWFAASDLNLYYNVHKPYGTSALIGFWRWAFLGFTSSETCASAMSPGKKGKLPM